MSRVILTVELTLRTFVADSLFLQFKLLYYMMVIEAKGAAITVS